MRRWIIIGIVIGVILLLLWLIPIILKKSVTNQEVESRIAVRVAELSEMNITSVENYEKYQEFVNRINSLILILNEESDLFNIPLWEADQESYNRASGFIEKYGPLVTNYNNVIIAAREFNKTKRENELIDFYSTSGKFAFETTIVFGNVFSTAFRAIGIGYKAVEFNILSEKCGGNRCIIPIITEAQSNIKDMLIDQSTKILEKIGELTLQLYKSSRDYFESYIPS